MHFTYIGMDNKDVSIEFCINDEHHYDYDYEGSVGEFICLILNNDYSALYHYGPKCYNVIIEEEKRAAEMEEQFREIEKLMIELNLNKASPIKEDINDAFLGIHKSVERRLNIVKECATSVNLNEYKSLINQVLLNVDDGLTNIQRFTAYQLVSDSYFLLKFDSSTSIAPDVIDVTDLDTNHYGNILMLTKELPFHEGIDKAKMYIKENRLACESSFTYSFKTFESLLNFVIYSMIKDNDIIKVCPNCGRYFSPELRSDTVYCLHPSPQDKSKSCREYGAIKTYQDNLKTNECMGLYRKIYMQKQMLSKRNPDIKIYTDEFEAYKNLSKQWKNDVKKGIKTESEYLAWLKSFRKGD